jgi:hypothetical protein
VLAILLIALPVSANAKATSTSKAMSFEQCLAMIRNVSQQFGVAPSNIVETNAVRMVRFPTANGSVLVTCSRADNKMVMTKSDKR